LLFAGAFLAGGCSYVLRVLFLSASRTCKRDHVTTEQKPGSKVAGAREHHPPGDAAISANGEYRAFHRQTNAIERNQETSDSSIVRKCNVCDNWYCWVNGSGTEVPARPALG
jgi:hypothetical protein